MIKTDNSKVNYNLIEENKKLKERINQLEKQITLFKSFLQKVVQETDVGDLTWQTRDEANDLVSTFFCEDEDLEYSSKKCKKQCLGCNWIENL